MSREGGRVFNNVDDVPFETYILKKRLSWVTFISMFPLCMLTLGVARVSIWAALVVGLFLFFAWLKFLVNPLNKHDENGDVSELLVSRGLLRALVHRSSRPELPANRNRT